MAYVSLLSVTQTIEQVLNPDYRTDQQSSVSSVRSLHEKLSFLLSFLEDASLKDSETISNLEERIRVVAYEAEDVIESNILAQIHSEYRFRCCWEIIADILNVIPGCRHVYKKGMEFGRHRLSPEFGEGLEKLMGEIDSISEEVKKTKESNRTTEDLPQRNSFLASGSSSESVPSSDKAPMVGFEDDLLQIKEQLIRPSLKLEIISIYGMGGIGKTTLANNIYNDPFIADRFDVWTWATVSQTYRVQNILADLLKSRRFSGLSAGKSKEQLDDEPDEICDLKDQLHKSLKGQRYLIVIDDIWDTSVWDEIKRLFPNDNMSSRIILTTRELDVAKIGQIHHMNLLGSNESWNILHKKVFGDKHCPSNLEKVGRKIADNCKGLPLAIAVIGGLLYKSEKTIDHWIYVAENMNFALATSKDEVMSILSLSYDKLPHYLRACFLYMGAFPEDYEIQKSRLIKLWVAEGFLKPDQSKTMEEVAEEYLKDLIDRNLILAREWRCKDKIKSCSIHDMMRELCIKKAKEEKFLQVLEEHNNILPEVVNRHRHVSAHRTIHGCLTDIYDATMRSLLFFNRCHINSISLSFIIYHQLLKVLDVVDLSFNKFPLELVELVNLRYIAFTCEGKSFKVPVSISRLCNLQTLIILQNNITISTIYITSEIWLVPQLRHLLLERCYFPYPSGVPSCIKGVVLESLQTLDEVENFVCTKEVAKMMPNLKKLGTSYHHDKNTDWSSYCFENFVHLLQLENLKCIFVRKNFNADKYPPLPVKLALPRKLKKLTLSKCRISWEYMSVIGLLPDLEVLKLNSVPFDGPLWEPKEGEFSSLKYLFLNKSELERWEADQTHFPVLERLSLRYCSKLAMIPSEIGYIPTLQVIQLFNCSKDVVASAQSIKEEQEGMNDCLQVHVYYSHAEDKRHNGKILRKMQSGISLDLFTMNSLMKGSVRGDKLGSKFALRKRLKNQ